MFSEYLKNADNVLSIIDTKKMVQAVTEFDPMSDPEFAEVCEYMCENGIILNASESSADNLEAAVIQLAKKILNTGEKNAIYCL